MTRRATSGRPGCNAISVAKGPCVDGSELARLFSRMQHWSVQPCVRPLGAVHMTAGHNALRGSGPGQKPAFDDAMAQVGCPDRRIDRLCITCGSPSQPSHHAGCPARSRLPRKRDGFLVALALGHYGPGHSRNLVGKRDGGNLGRLSRQQRREPCVDGSGLASAFSRFAALVGAAMCSAFQCGSHDRWP